MAICLACLRLPLGLLFSRLRTVTYSIILGIAAFCKAPLEEELPDPSQSHADEVCSAATMNVAKSPAIDVAVRNVNVSSSWGVKPP